MTSGLLPFLRKSADIVDSPNKEVKYNGYRHFTDTRFAHLLPVNPHIIPPEPIFYLQEVGENLRRGHKLTVPIPLKQCRIVAPNIALLTTIVKGQ